MSFRSFLWATQAFMAEEGISFVDGETGVAPEPSPADIRAQNAQSMQMLQGMMSGVKGAPKVGRR